MNVSCPYCKETGKTVVYPKKDANSFDIVKCNQCGHLYTWIDREVDTDDLYSSEAYKLDDQRNSIFYKIQRYEYTTMLKRALSFVGGRPYKPSILDFGSGKGHLLSFARDLGMEVYGVETATERAAFATENYQLTISTDYYQGEGLVLNRDYDLITMIHVLEHLPEPELIVSGLFRDVLKKSGVMVIEVPNIHSWQARLGGSSWLHLDLPRHINHHTPEYLKRFLNTLGGEIAAKETLSFHHGIIGMLQSLMSIFGYRNSLIVDLKFNRRIGLVIAVLLLVVPAFLLEGLAAMFGQGGMIRYYYKKS